MQPMMLKMKNFGPYLDEKVDFSQMAQEIFLITGPTGSGKTTLFDGMCYALFGESSGNDRIGREMKSQFANPFDVMEVEFTFALQNRLYRVHRIPEQERMKKKGSGTARQKHEAELFEITEEGDVLLAATVDEVREEIQKRIGLTAAQFRQIVMLPQGQFSQLLKAGSDEREKLLKSIFDLSIYEALKEQAGKKVNQLQQETIGIEEHIRVEIGHLQIEEASLLEKMIQTQSRTAAWMVEQVQRQNEADLVHVNDLEKESLTLDEQVQLLENKIAEGKTLNQRFDEQRELERQKKALEQETDSRRRQEKDIEKGRSALRVHPFAEALETAQKRRDKAKVALTQSEEDYAKANNALETLQAAYERVTSSDFDDEVAEKEVQLNGLQALEQLFEEEKSLKQQYADALETVKATAEKQAHLEQQRKQLEKNKQQLDSCQYENHRLKEAQFGHKQTLTEQRQKLDAMCQQQKEWQTIVEAEQKLIRQRENYRNLKRNYEAAEQSLNRLTQQQAKNAAAALAARLTEGEPCPVCGSVHHPAPMTEQKNVEKETLDCALKAYQKAQQALSEAQAKGKADAEALQILKEQLAEALEGSVETVGRKATGDALAEAITACKRDMAQLEVAAAEVEKAISAETKQIETLNQWIVENEKALQSDDTLQEQSEAAQANANRLAGQLESNAERKAQQFSVCGGEILDEASVGAQKKEITAFIKAQKGYKINITAKYQNADKQMTEAQTRLLAAKENDVIEAAALEEQQKRVQTALAEAGLTAAEYRDLALVKASVIEAEAEDLKAYQAKLQRVETQLEILAAALEGKAPTDLTTLEAKRQTAKENAEMLHNKIFHLKQRYDINRKQCDVIQGLLIEQERAEQQTALYKMLNDTLRGTLSGRQKISFERYILSAYLQDILDASNHYLTRMSGGRYMLTLLSDEGTSRRGLEMAVADAYTGESRSTSTLSGGETFMAALAMALGLSETVQATSGGVSLSTIFIDEGFATLDPEALDNAIDCLLTLQGDGRTVGIISHVAELKERIDAKIIIEKTDAGSRIREVK